MEPGAVLGCTKTMAGSNRPTMIALEVDNDSALPKLLEGRTIAILGGPLDNYTAEAHEPARRRQIHDQLQRARRLRASLEEAADRAEALPDDSPSSYPDAMAILQKSLPEINQLVRLTEALQGNHTIDDPAEYEEWNEWTAQKNEREEGKRKREQRVFRRQLREFAKEKNPELELDEGVERKHDSLIHRPAESEDWEDGGDEEKDAAKAALAAAVPEAPEVAAAASSPAVEHRNESTESDIDKSWEEYIPRHSELVAEWAADSEKSDKEFVRKPRAGQKRHTTDDDNDDEGGAARNAFSEESGRLAPNSLSCKCKKSRCLRLYCDCFHKDQYCVGCACIGCRNTPLHDAQRDRAIADILDGNPNAFKPRTKAEIKCKCTRTACLKKHCECFAYGKYCGDLCACRDCENLPLEEVDEPQKPSAKRAKVVRKMEGGNSDSSDVVTREETPAEQRKEQRKAPPEQLKSPPELLTASIPAKREEKTSRRGSGYESVRSDVVAAGGGRKKNVTTAFPVLLHDMVTDCTANEPHVCAWTAKGDAFAIKASGLMPPAIGRYFNHNNYRSLQRMMYHYNFKRCSDEYDGVYYHPHFNRWSTKEELVNAVIKGGDVGESERKPRGGSASKTPSGAKRAEKNARPPKRCHNCKRTSPRYRSCNYWSLTGKCRKFYCIDCLSSSYTLGDDVASPANPSGVSIEEILACPDLDAEWHCPSCLGNCQCEVCTKERKRKEEREKSRSEAGRKSSRRSAGGSYQYFF